MKKPCREKPVPRVTRLFHNFRPTPLAFALLCLSPAAAQAALNLPPFQVDPGLLQPTPGAGPAQAQKPAAAQAALNLPLFEVDPGLLQPAPKAGTVQTQKSAASPEPVAAPPVRHPQEAEGTPLQLRPSPALALKPPPDSQATPIFVSAERIQGHQNAEIEAEGGVELRKQGQSVQADYLRYDSREDEVFARGNVVIEQRGDVMRGTELRLKLEERQGYMTAPVYQLGEQHARGDAAKVLFQGKDLTELQQARYTTCPVGTDDWFLRASQLELDRSTEVGTAHHTSVVFKDVPLLYMPWMTFPLTDKRKSGFLAPNFGSTGNSGMEISLPYYWNIAPNRDATLTPRLLSKRGLQLNTEFRYLEPSFAGQADVEWLPSDSVANRDRYALVLKQQHDFGQGWGGALNLNKVSDDNYYRDLSTHIAATSQTNLPREGVLTYTTNTWAFAGRVQRFQTLQDPLAPLVEPYERVPQLQLNGAWLDMRGLDATLGSEFVYFHHPQLTSGKRLVFYPNLSLPLIRGYGYLTPKIGWHYTQYALDENPAALPDSTRSLPILSVDSGLTFERLAEYRGQNFVQTLEPRLYYVYIPYRDQSRLPNFDSAEADFNLAQIFSENQFSGSDRINDANQVTLALTSRLLEPESGRERLRATVGQRYYLRDQRVTLSSPARSAGSSDLLAAVGGQIAPSWSLDGTVQYNASQSQTERLGIGARYQPETGKVLNLSHRFIRGNLEQIDVSGQWPLVSRWSGVGRWNYSLRDRQILEGLAGLEYNGGCWATRLVMHRLTTATTQVSNSIFVQLELYGVSRIGSNPLDVLQRNISGYVKPSEIRDETEQKGLR